MKKIILLFIVAAFWLTGSAQIGPYEGLYKLAAKVRPGFLIGSTGVRLSGPDSEDQIRFYLNNFNIMTVTIYMHTTQREQGSYNLSNVDQSVDFAQHNNLKVYFHPLIGGAEYCPDWIKKGNYSKEELEKIMRDRITTILNRYAQSFIMWML